MLSFNIRAFIISLAFLANFSGSSWVFAASLGNQTDKLSLLNFKSQLNDESVTSLRSWNESIPFCQWTGVTCGLRHQRVVSLSLGRLNLVGKISPHLGNLSFLHSLNLEENSFYGGIPSELTNLFRLQVLNLSYNSLRGQIPLNLSCFFKLSTLSLEHTNIQGQIPSEIGLLSNLVILSLANNDLRGRFPPSLGNLTHLKKLQLLYNHLDGEIPATVNNLKKLTNFEVKVNNFSGVFPPSLYNLSSLQVITLSLNNFYGVLRQDMFGALPYLQTLFMSSTKFVGPLPVSLINATNLQDLNLINNKFIGGIDRRIGNLKKLKGFNVGSNNLGSAREGDLEFLTSMTNCSNLGEIIVSSCNLGGKLPNSITNLSSHLTSLDLGGNYIYGSIPLEISRLANLGALRLYGNLLTGIIPDSLGNLQHLSQIEFGDNRLSGEIPSSLGNITYLTDLYMYNNSLHGNLPSSLGKCKYLKTIHICHNKLNGTILEPLIDLSSVLVDLNVSHNSFSGPLSSLVGSFGKLVDFDVSYNKLSGSVSSELGKCLGLEILYLQSNLFEGTIPDLSQLKGIQYLDLSANSLSGQIPSFMGDFMSLQNLNLSFNNLEGEVPEKGVFRNASSVQLSGNSKLCSRILKDLQLPPCPFTHHYIRHSKKQLSNKAIAMISSGSVFVALVLFLTYFRLSRKSKNKLLQISSSFGNVYLKFTYQDLLDATGGFSLNNLIGSGGFGTIYKGVVGVEKTPFAVKVFNLQTCGALKSFISECEALRCVRHRNLVKVLSACSSTDFKGNDFKALIYEFMPNGSLENWLHGISYLGVLQRINIAIDVASAMLYLHHECPIRIVHCDLKPSNILLDDDLTAHVSDFGLARLLARYSKDAIRNHFSSNGLKGTIGYAAPEYGMGAAASINGDMYSFGMLLLEMCTGKRPTDEIFIDDLNLHNYVMAALPERVMDIIDPSLHESEKATSFSGDHVLECLVAIMVLGVTCSAEDPKKRLNMKEVVMQLHQIKEDFLKGNMLQRAAQMEGIKVASKSAM